MQLGADVDRIGRVDCTIAFLDVLDLALLVHHKRGAAGKLHLFIQDAVFLGDLARHVAKQGEFDSDFFGKRLIGRRSINADSKNRRIFEVNLARVDTSLVSLKLFRSATSESKDIEGQYDVLFSPVIAQFYRRSLAAAQAEIRSDIANLKKCVSQLGLCLLRLSKGQSENRSSEQNY